MSDVEYKYMLNYGYRCEWNDTQGPHLNTKEELRLEDPFYNKFIESFT